MIVKVKKNISGVIGIYFLPKKKGTNCLVLAIIITEFVVLILRLWIVRDGYDFRYAFQDIPKYFLIAIITLVVGLAIPNLIPSAFINMAVKSILMFILYVGLMFAFKLDFNQDIVVLIKKFLKRG